MSNWIFVDVEASGVSPARGIMTEFGAVHASSRKTFHGILYKGTPDPENPAKPIVGERVASEMEVSTNFCVWLEQVCGKGRPIFVSDNPAYDYMWIAAMFDVAGFNNPFGHSARRISDFWAGLQNNWGDTQSWKRFRVTPHDHNPVNDAMGNVEAFEKIKEIATQHRRQHKVTDMLATDSKPPQSTSDAPTIASLLTTIESEIIGEDEPEDPNDHPFDYGKQYGKNELRAEQRKALAKLRKKYL